MAGEAYLIQSMRGSLVVLIFIAAVFVLIVLRHAMGRLSNRCAGWILHLFREIRAISVRAVLAPPMVLFRRMQSSLSSLLKNLLSLVQHVWRGFVRPGTRTAARVKSRGNTLYSSMRIWVSLMREHQYKKNKWKRLARIALYALLLAAFLELSSAVLLSKAVDPTRMKRFDDLFFEDPLNRSFLPHPFLGWVDQQYLREQERYLNRLGKDRNETVYIVAMGGLTTADGWPHYTESYLNDRLQEMNASLRVEVFNFGVGAWNTINSIQNYVFITRYLHPDIIIFHHNINDVGGIDERFFSRRQGYVLQFPLVGGVEKALLRGSRFYKLLRFVYFVSYNRVRYGKDMVGGTDASLFPEMDVPMQSRISSYLSDSFPWAGEGDHFQIRSLRSENLPEVRREFVLNESYEWLIRATESDNSAFVMTTMYLNYSKWVNRGDHPSQEPNREISNAINDLIRQASRRHNVTLVDLAEEMEPYDSLLIDDGVHWVEEGIRLKGELVGEEVFEVIKERYSLGSAPEVER